jgi:DNA-binding CsgD family transcriptional regulator
MSLKNIILPKNHKFLTSTNEIKQICAPLEYLNIQMFTYRRRFRNGSEIYLSTNVSWIDDYFRLGLYQSSLFEAEIHHYPTGFLPWPKESNLAVFKHGQLYYNSFSGITYCNNESKFCELFFFSFNRDIIDISPNIDLLEKFVFSFKEKADRLIKQCAPYIVTPPTFALDPSVDLYLSLIADNSYKKQRDQFLKSMEDNRIAILNAHLVNLTARERDCLDLLIRFHSLSKIANILGISYRTVETHISNIKEKLHCRSKIELILKVNKLMSSA